MNVKITDFGGVNPLLDNKKLPVNAAQKAENCILNSGRLEPLEKLEYTADLADEKQQTIYLHKYRYSLLSCGTTGTTEATGWNSITDGAFKITADGNELEVTGLDFTGAVDMNAVAAIVQDNLRNKTGNFETITFDAENNSFIFRSNRTFSTLSSPAQPEEPATVTDISGETYLNGQSGNAVLQENLEYKKWLSWAADVDVVYSTVNNDRFERLYYTGDGSGKLKVLGNFGERTVEYPEPPKPDGLTKNDTLLEKFNTKVICVTHVNSSAAIECPPIAEQPHVRTEDGFILYFHFPGWYTTATSGLFWANHVSQLVFTNDDPEKEDDVLPQTISPLKGSANGETLALYDSEDEEIGMATIAEIESFNPDASWDPIPDISEKTILSPYDFSIELTIKFAKAAEDFYYVQRYVDDTGAEGQPGEVSKLIIRNPGETVYIGALNNNESGLPAHIKKRRLYRSSGSVEEADYYYIDEIDIAQTSYHDIIKTSALAEKMPPFGNPPDGLTGLITMSNGFYAAFKGKDIYFSEPYLPYAWPWKYSRTVDYEIVGLASLFNSLVVMTTGKLYIFTGSSPDIMNQVDLSFNQACVSKRGICRTESSIFYPSPDGMVRVSGGNAALATENIFSRADWQAIRPETMISESYENMIHAFTDNSSFIFNFSAGAAAVTTHDERCSGMYSDIEYDRLYLIQETRISCWRESAENKKISWKSKSFEFPRPISWNCAKVIAENYPEAPDNGEIDRRVALKMYANGNLAHTAYFYTPRAIKLPMLRPETEWEFEIESFVPVDSVSLATSIQEV